MREEWSTNANDAVEIGFLDGSKMPIKFFHPAFTYPIFGDKETIFGYKNLSVKLFFKADDLTSVIDVKYDNIIAGGVGEEDDQATDVVAKLKECLPEDVSTNLTEFRTQTVFSPDFKPPGKLISSFTNSKSQKFEVYHSSLKNEACKKLLNNVQIMVLFFIEGGSTIDVDDEEWTTDRWDVYFVYQVLDEPAAGDARASPLRYSFAGYCTVYKYLWFNIRKDEEESFRSRISQFIVAPPYQKTGCGREMYGVVVNNLLSDNHVREITVEDPSEVFEEMRDHSDLRRLRTNGTFSESEGFVLETLCEQSEQARTWIENQRLKNKFQKRQFLRLIEIQFYSILRKEGGGSSGGVNQGSDRYKAYKRFVKRRLYKHNKDILSQLDKEKRMEKVEETFVGVVEDYGKILDNIEKFGGGVGSHEAGPSDKKRRISAATRDDKKDDDGDEQMSGTSENPVKRTKT